jgi:hypothetical protein
MAGLLGIGIGLLVLGLLGLIVFPWGGIVVAVLGLLLIVGFLLGIGRRSAQPRT